MPSYPLTFPATPNIQNFSIRPVRVVGAVKSQYTLEHQIYDHEATQWIGEISMAPMRVDSAFAWEVFILQLRGMVGTFLMGPPLSTPTGTGTTGDLLTAGSQGDESVSVQNAGSGATFKAGNWLQIGSSLSARLHKITADATADGSGFVTLNIEPALKQDHVINSLVTVSSPVGVWRMASNDVGWNINAAATFGFTVPVLEAL